MPSGFQYVSIVEVILMINKSIAIGLLLGGFAFIHPLQAEATYIHEASSVTYVTAGSSTSPNLMIDQSGLGTSYASGVTDFDAYNPASILHNWQYDPASGNATEWFGDYSTLIGDVVFDLGGLFTVDRIAFWNEDGEGINSVDVSYSTDGSSYGAAQTFAINNSEWGSDYVAQILTLTTPGYAQFIKFNLTAAKAEDGYPNLSIGEVAFSVAEPTNPVPEPATLLLFATGIVGFLGAKGRKRK